jgi:thymidylate synthase ThyX
MVRGSRQAQWEVRELAVRILKIMKEEAPNVFFDLEVTKEDCVERRPPRASGDTG